MWQLQLLEACRQADRWRIASSPGLVVVEPHVNAAVEESPRGQHDGAGTECDPDLRDGADHAVAFDHQIIDSLLKQGEIRLILESAPDRRLVEHAIGLGTGCTHCRALARIEHPELNAAFVRRNRHGAAKCVDFLHQVALADAANRGIAAHLPERLDVVGKQQRAGAHAGGCKRGFGAGMTAANDDHIEFFGVQHESEGALTRALRKGALILIARASSCPSGDKGIPSPPRSEPLSALAFSLSIK